MINDLVFAVQSNVGDDGGTQRLTDACVRMGISVIEFDAVPFDTSPPNIPEGNVFVFGGSRTVEIVADSGRWADTVFQGEDKLGVMACLRYWGDNMLNSDATTGTFSDFANRVPSESVFIRPDADSKAFAGLAPHRVYA